jgi:hypothetical protein
MCGQKNTYYGAPPARQIFIDSFPVVRASCSRPRATYVRDIHEHVTVFSDLSGNSMIFSKTKAEILSCAADSGVVPEH